MSKQAVAFGLVLITGVGLNAQNIPGNPSRAGNPITTEIIKVSDEVTATGCLSKNDSGVFQLKNAGIEVRPWMDPQAEKILGKSVAMKSTTTVDLKDAPELDSHLGQGIEVTGVLAPGSANTPPTPDTIGGPGGTTGVPVGGVARFDRPKLQVKSLKEVNSACH